MDVILISTEQDTWALGLRSISSVLREAGHHTRLVFMPTTERVYSEKTLRSLAQLADQFSIVGVSCLARGSEKAKQVISHLHSLNKFTVWGGVHASLNPDECTDWADVICLGEGEGMMLDLVDHLSRGEDWRSIENAAYKENGKLIVNNLRPVIDNLDDLPLPDLSFADELHLSQERFNKVTTLPGIKRGGPILFNSSRGCAFHCSYCCNVKLKSLYPVKGRYVRRMSVPRLIEHVQNLKRIFPQGKYIYFIDEDFAARPIHELIEFADEYSKTIGLPFECLSHPARVTHQKIDLLSKAGLFRINIGVESGSERTKRMVFDRQVSNEAVVHALQVIKSYPNIMPYYFFIIGNPFDQREDLLETAKLITSFPSHCTIKVYNLVFFPGSKIYDRACEEKIINGKHDSGYELDFLAGLNYKDHAWKKQNLFLNGLIFLMDGQTTDHFIGILPRSFASWLLKPQQVNTFEKHPFMIEALIKLKFFTNTILHASARIYKKLSANPVVIYNMNFYLRKKVFRNNAE